MNAQQIIDLLKLEPLSEEGGFFRRTYRAEEQLSHTERPDRHLPKRAVGTAIYALFTVDNFSAMHRLDADEIYHFYRGDPLEMLLLHPGGVGEICTLGPRLEAGMTPQKVVARDVWQGSRVPPGGKHEFSLIGTTMAPGFEWSGFELGDAAQLKRKYPDFAGAIRARTR